MYHLFANKISCSVIRSTTLFLFTFGSKLNILSEFSLIRFVLWTVELEFWYALLQVVRGHLAGNYTKSV